MKSPDLDLRIYGVKTATIAVNFPTRNKDFVNLPGDSSWVRMSNSVFRRIRMYVACHCMHIPADYFRISRNLGPSLNEVCAPKSHRQILISLALWYLDLPAYFAYRQR